VTVFWPALIGGVLSVAGALALLKHRAAVARFTADMQRQTFGEGVPARRFQSAATSRNMLYPAVIWLVMGIALVVTSFLGLDW
jgi:2-hydroxychromene-2-carboxylate isomerase